MRFIGNKTLLLDDIKNFIDENIEYKDDLIFCDIFSGSSSVARYFKKYYNIISNDILYFSYVLQKATVELNEIPNFSKLENFQNIKDITEYFEKTPLKKLQNEYSIPANDLFLYNNYTPSNNSDRMYFTPKIGKRIDLMRIIIEKWFNSKLITEDEYYYLIMLLIETVPFYSNISGVYAAYLKHWDKRALKPFKLANIELYNNGTCNQSYNEDAHNIIKKIEGDILYIDPPYNHRQYSPNYHVLETIAKYDYPEIKGVSGMRDYSAQVSKFCRKKDVAGALEDIVKNANFKYIIMSYSTDGILSSEKIEEIFKKYGKKNTYKMANPIKYRKYKSKQKQKKKDLHELLFFIEKDVNINPKRQILKKNEKNNSYENTIQTLLTQEGYKPKKIKKTFLKSPFNYIGGKYKLLPQLYNEFPTKISTFVDMFGGGFNVGINTDAKKIIYNDQITPLVKLFKYFQKNEINEIIDYIENNIKKYNIKKYEKDGYLKFRELYNKKNETNPLDLYILLCFSFNHQIRYNNSGEFNCPHGTKRSNFSENMKNNLIEFIKTIQNKDISFYDKDFRDINLSNLNEKSFVYCDPPYLITTGSYNDGNRGFKNWTEKEEKDLLKLLNDLDKKNIKFGLSNVTFHDSKSNNILIDWIEKNNYKKININSDYNNSNYQKKKNIEKNEEVLVINY